MKKLIGIVLCVFLLGCPAEPVSNAQKLVDEIEQIEESIQNIHTEERLIERRDALQDQLDALMKARVEKDGASLSWEPDSE